MTNNPLEIISIILAILCFVIILLVGFLTDLLRESKSKTAPYSFSRTQFWVWTLIICPAFVLNWGFKNPTSPMINETALILLGISMAVTTAATVVTAAQNSTANTANAAANPTTTPVALKASGTTHGFWIDILLSDNDQFSVLRLQQLIFTIIYIGVYITMFFSGGKVYPKFDYTAYILMGVSTGSYLVGKGLNK